MTEGRPMRCQVCGKALCVRGRAVTGLCIECRRAGAEFARSWMAELRDQGLTIAQIAQVVGTTSNAVATRLYQRRLAAAATTTEET